MSKGNPITKDRIGSYMVIDKAPFTRLPRGFGPQCPDVSVSPAATRSQCASTPTTYGDDSCGTTSSQRAMNIKVQTYTHDLKRPTNSTTHAIIIAMIETDTTGSFIGKPHSDDASVVLLQDAKDSPRNPFRLCHMTPRCSLFRGLDGRVPKGFDLSVASSPLVTTGHRSSVAEAIAPISSDSNFVTAGFPRATDLRVTGPSPRFRNNSSPTDTGLKLKGRPYNPLPTSFFQRSGADGVCR